MSTAKNVIDFNFSDGKNRHNTVPELLKSAKHIAVKTLDELTDTLFNNTDDCLFEYADKAVNNEQQTEYLDAMREIRLKKPAMKQALFADFDRQFDLKLSLSVNTAASISQVQDNQYASGMGLSLVDEDELEESLAITNMASRVYSEYREPLSALIQRMNEVYEAKEINKESNPLSPDIICNAFSKAVACLSSNLEIKLIVYKLFDKFVVRHIGKLYHDINEMFVAAGVLPTIKYKMPIIQSQSKSQSKVENVEDDVDRFLSELNHGQVNAGHANMGHMNAPSASYAAPGHNSMQNPMPSGYAQGAFPGATMDGANVLEMMRQALYQYRGEAGPGLQPLSDASLSAIPPAGISPASVISGGGNAIGGKSAPSRGAITGADTDAMESDTPTAGEPGTASGGPVYYVTSDVIAGLSRIQTKAARTGYQEGQQSSGEFIKSQVLRVVQAPDEEEKDKTINSADADIIDIVSMMFDYILNDKSLPDRTKAVISRLQIPMVKVAILDKAFFNRKTHPARALLNELANASNVLDSQYDDGDTLFDEIERVVGRILEEFDSNVDLFEELLTEFLEFQAREIQANQLAEQIILDAKQTVADEIEKRLRQHKIPDVVSQFILGPWKDVMTVIGTQDQCEGIAWNSASMFLDDLIWSVQPKHFNDERRQLTMLIPRMLPSLREGMALLDNHDYDLPGFLAELQKIHLDLLRVQKPHAAPHSDSTEAFDETAQWDDVDDSDRSSAGSSSNGDDFMDDIILQGDKHDSYQFDMADPQLMQSRFFNTVRTMELGTWVEFKTNDGDKRGKLTWKCDFTGEYTFMNRMYKVVADIGMRKLIHCMEQGTASIVEDTPMFDRAVNAIMNSVKNLRGAQPAAG